VRPLEPLVSPAQAQELVPRVYTGSVLWEDVSANDQSKESEVIEVVDDNRCPQTARPNNG